MTPPVPDRPVAALVGTVVAGYALLAWAAVAPGLNLAGVLLGLVLAVAVVGLQLGYVSRPGVRRTRETTALALAALVCLVAVPVVAVGVGWIGFAGFLAASALLLLPPRAGAVGFAAVVVAVGLVAALVGSAPLSATLTAALATVVSGLAIAGLSRWWELTAAQAVVVEPAVVEPPVPALAEALATARAELDAAGIELAVLGEDVEVPDEVGDRFAALVRVAVAHAARHADATTCHVTVARRGSEARIVVTHDGATEDPVPDDFEALGDRFDAADGTVLAERDDEQFTVEGRLPLP